MLKNLRSKLRYRSFVLTIATTCFLNCALATEIARSQDLDKRISIDVEKKTLKETLDQISKQAHIGIIYSNAKGILKNPVTIHAKDQPVSKVLSELLSPLTLTYEIIGDQIVVKFDDTSSRPPSQGQTQELFNKIKGKVKDEQGQPLPGATVKILNETAISITDKDGNFSFDSAPDNGILVVSFIGYQTENISFRNTDIGEITVLLRADANSLNEVQVIGYGTTTKRFNTGSVSAITSKEIENQPVTNVLSSLSGRMPGIFVQTTNGLPGGNINIQIRGKGSLLAGTNPLYIIDGVPFESSLINTGDPTTVGNINGIISPLNSLNPQDIESMSILKDADATAIYGSRGTNGVILITTKKGKSGKDKIDINLSNGITEVASLPTLLNNDDYLQIRREAFVNSNRVPTAANAPDLLVWDNTNTTNWPKFLFGHVAHSTNANASVSGGNLNTTYNIGGNYHTESTILPGESQYQRGGVHFTLQHFSNDRKFNISVTNSLIKDFNKASNPQYASSGILLPPNFPAIQSNGEYFWRASNPLAEINSTSKINTDNIISNLSLGYRFFDDLNFKINAGYNKISIEQSQIFPTSSLPPGSINYSQFGNNSNQSIIVEPQLDYTKSIGDNKLSVLAGATYQNQKRESQFLLGSNFSNEGLMEDLSSAGTIDGRQSLTIQYKYVSMFGRLNYAYSNKYIINATIRRDGSSRFGPGNQFGTFGAIGAAWIFSEEGWLKKMLPFVSFGKLRGSYGIVGNDQISDYQYLTTYSSSYNTYQGIAALSPSRISNADFHWETTKKLDYAIELGFFNNRLLFNADRYVNKTEDQLVQYSVPSITGFNSYQANLPAVVENSGWELELNTKNIQGKLWNWSSTFNFTTPKNKLVSFDNFGTSSYAQTLQLGYDITRIYGYQFLGVNPSTGLASYATQPGSSSTDPYQYNTIGKQTPDFYGGFGNTVSYKNWSIDLFLQFTKQMGIGGLRAPGAAANNYPVILTRWQKPGDITTVPKPMTSVDNYYAGSTVNYFNTSYIRIKNVSLDYTFPKRWTDKMSVDRMRIYFQGQNLFTFWNKDSAVLDPESGALTAVQNNIPPVRTFIIGLQVTL